MPSRKGRKKKDNPRNTKRRPARVRGGERYEQTYETAGTVWYRYESEEFLPTKIRESLEDETEAVYFPPEFLAWLGYSGRLLLSHHPLRLQVRLDADAEDTRTGVTHPVSTYRKLTQAQILSLPSGEEEVRRERARRRGRKIDAHEEATSIYGALVAQFTGEGLTDRAARGAARREIQTKLGYANARSVTNLLQPGGRRGVSEKIKGILDGWYSQLGSPGLAVTPKRTTGTHSGRTAWISEWERELLKWVRGVEHDYGDLTFVRTTVEGQDFKH